MWNGDGEYGGWLALYVVVDHVERPCLEGLEMVLEGYSRDVDEAVKLEEAYLVAGDLKQLVWSARVQL